MPRRAGNGRTQQAKTIEAVKAWQAAGFVHPLTCRNDSAHRPLVPKAEGESEVVLVCPDCDYRQTWIPPVVTKGKLKNPLSDVFVPLSPLNFEETVRRVRSDVRGSRTTEAERQIAETIANIRRNGVQIAPQEQIDRHPDVLADFMWRFYRLSPSEYAYSDESHLFDDGKARPEAWRKAIKRTYGVDLPQDEEKLYLWMVIDLIATKRTR